MFTKLYSMCYSYCTCKREEEVVLSTMEPTVLQARMCHEEERKDFSRSIEGITHTQTLLGEGGFGKVYLVTLVCGLQVVKKHIPFGDGKQYFTALNETRLHAMCVHPNIARFLGSYSDKDTFYMVMEYVSSLTLFDIVVKDTEVFKQRYTTFDDGAHIVDEKRRRAYLTGLLDAVQYLHAQNIAHRDIKLENIIVDTNCDHSYLIDFGFATSQGTALIHSCFGSMTYLSPECAVGKPWTGFGADIWSIGIVTFTLLYGAFPFTKASSKESPTFYKAERAQRLGVSPLRSFLQAYDPPLADASKAPFMECEMIDASLAINMRTRVDAKGLRDLVRCGVTGE